MKTIEELARVAYNAYGGHTQWKNYAGHPMPHWDDLPATIRGAWCAAANAVAVTNDANPLVVPSDPPKASICRLVVFTPSNPAPYAELPAVVVRPLVSDPRLVDLEVMAVWPPVERMRYAVPYSEHPAPNTWRWPRR